MSKTKYVRNDTDAAIIFPTLVPPLSLERGEVAGIPDDVRLPVGVTAARASDHKGDGKPTVHEHAGDPVERTDDPWVGDPSPSLEPTVDLPVDPEPGAELLPPADSTEKTLAPAS